jgi:hypothetical protein
LDGKNQKELNGEAVKAIFTAEGAEERRERQEENLLESESFWGNQKQEPETNSLNLVKNQDQDSKVNPLDFGFNPDSDFLVSGFSLRNSASSAVNDLSVWEGGKIVNVTEQKKVKNTVQ